MISNLTALIIQTRNDIFVTAGGGPNANGKWMGWITLGPEDRYRPLLNSEILYDSKEEAVAAMQKIVDDIRSTAAA